ncbi:MAG: methyltransferase domain-containing protein [Candidatus Bathyarchaeota archaeon]
MENKKIKDFLKKWFAEIATKDCSSCSITCNLSCGDSPKYIAWKNGYSPTDLENVPQDSILGLGCGNPFNFLNITKKETILVLESGAGMDVFLASKKVGLEGKIIGISMTLEMIERSRKTALMHGFTNVEFKMGEIDCLPIEDETIDVVIANSAINLYLDKINVFKEIYRVIKVGGRLSVCDLVTNENLPENVSNSFEAWARGIGGALKKDEYVDKIVKSGFATAKILSQKPYTTDFYPKLRGKITSVQIQTKK